MTVRCMGVCSGDATWSVSTGLGACMAAGVYEVGRPRRVTAEEAADIDTRWRDFGGASRSRAGLSWPRIRAANNFASARKLCLGEPSALYPSDHRRRVVKATPARLCSTRSQTLQDDHELPESVANVVAHVLWLRALQWVSRTRGCSGTAGATSRRSSPRSDGTCRDTAPPRRSPTSSCGASCVTGPPARRAPARAT